MWKGTIMQDDYFFISNKMTANLEFYIDRVKTLVCMPVWIGIWSYGGT